MLMLLNGQTEDSEKPFNLMVPGQEFVAQDTLIYMSPLIFKGMLSEIDDLDRLKIIVAEYEKSTILYKDNILLQEDEIDLLKYKINLLERKNLIYKIALTLSIGLVANDLLQDK